jgi:hypothetical protein
MTAPTFTYTNDPLNVQLDYVRDKIGDVDEGDPLLYDGEINAEIATQPSLLIAAAICASKIANRFAREVNKQSGSEREQSSDLLAHYRTVAEDLYNEAYGGSSASSTLVGKIVPSDC